MLLSPCCVSAWLMESRAKLISFKSHSHFSFVYDFIFVRNMWRLSDLEYSGNVRRAAAKEDVIREWKETERPRTELYDKWKLSQLMSQEQCFFSSYISIYTFIYTVHCNLSVWLVCCAYTTSLKVLEQPNFPGFLLKVIPDLSQFWLSSYFLMSLFHG